MTVQCPRVAKENLHPIRSNERGCRECIRDQLKLVIRSNLLVLHIHIQNHPADLSNRF